MPLLQPAFAPAAAKWPHRVRGHTAAAPTSIPLTRTSALPPRPAHQRRAGSSRWGCPLAQRAGSLRVGGRDAGHAVCRDQTWRQQWIAGQQEQRRRWRQQPSPLGSTAADTAVDALPTTAAVDRTPAGTHPGRGRRSWCSAGARGPGTPSWRARGSEVGRGGGRARVCAGRRGWAACSRHPRQHAAQASTAANAHTSATPVPLPTTCMPHAHPRPSLCTCAQPAVSKSAAGKAGGTASGRSYSLKRQASPFRLSTRGLVEASATSRVAGVAGQCRE